MFYQSMRTDAIAVSGAASVSGSMLLVHNFIGEV